jgi:hypothetical protein
MTRVAITFHAPISTGRINFDYLVHLRATPVTSISVRLSPVTAFPSTAHGAMKLGQHGLMARGGHRLPKVSPRPSMPNAYMPYSRFRDGPPVGMASLQGWAASGNGPPPGVTHPQGRRRAGSLRPVSTVLDNPHRMPMCVRVKGYQVERTLCKKNVTN